MVAETTCPDDRCHLVESSEHCHGEKSQRSQVSESQGQRCPAVAEHADSHPGVRDLLRKYHMRNFSIFLHQIDGKWYEFGYYEYTGEDYEADMEKMDQEPRIKEWLKVCDPMQVPLEGEKSWAIMERVYFND